MYDNNTNVISAITSNFDPKDDVRLFFLAIFPSNMSVNDIIINLSLIPIYIKERADTLNIKLPLGIDKSSIKFIKRGFNNAGLIRGRVHVDLYLLVRQYMNLDRYTLERVYKELFDIEKIDVPGDKIFEYWDSDNELLEKLFDYSMDDAITTTEIADKLTPLTVAQTRLVGQPLFDIARMTTGQMVEWYLIWKAFEKNNIIPKMCIRDSYCSMTWNYQWKWIGCKGICYWSCTFRSSY